MPTLKCKKCESYTNTAVAEYIDNAEENLKNETADGCYARYVNGKWEKGCLYETLQSGEFNKIFVDNVITQWDK